jgi:hypothetical protein
MLHLVASTLTFTPLALSKVRTTQPTVELGRREFCSTLGLAALVLRPSRAHAGDEQYKDLSTKVSSKLLTSAETAAESQDALATVNWGAPKATGLSTEEMAARIDAGLRRECWFITGRSLPEYFSNSFTFSDPQARRHSTR